MNYRIALFFLVVLVLIASPVQGQDVVSDLLGRINALRGSLGLPGYSLNGALAAAAMNQASWMAATGQISHTQSDGSTPSSRAAAAGYPSSAVSENIYMGTSATVDSAWQWWLNSPIHYRGITNAQYTEVGIGSAAGANGTAYVLVFGNPAGWGAVSIRRTTSGGDSAAAAPPSFVVGVDNVGNIMHEIQQGQTLGDIALIYGYTWDDLEYIRSINGMTEPEGRYLQIGAILLIPPWDGTYTPTPGSPLVEMTPDAQAAQPTLIVDDTAALTSAPAPTLTPTLPGEIGATSAVMPEWVVMTANAHLTETPARASTLPAVPTAQSAGWTAATVTPQAVAQAVTTAVVPTPLLVESAQDDNDETSPLLVVAVVLQVIILGVAGYEFWHRRG